MVLKKILPFFCFYHKESGGAHEVPRIGSDGGEGGDPNTPLELPKPPGNDGCGARTCLYNPL